MKFRRAPDGPAERDQPSPFAHLPAYPQHDGDASSAVPSHGGTPTPGHGSEVMRYEIKQHKLLEKGPSSIFDDFGNLRFTVPGHGGICDSSGYELFTFSLRPFRRQADILRNGYTIASVHTVGLGLGGKFRIDSLAGPITVHGEFFVHNYRLTGPGGDIVATVWQQQGFHVEIPPRQDDVLLLASILAIEDIRDRRRA